MTRPSRGSSDSTSASNDTRRAPAADRPRHDDHGSNDERAAPVRGSDDRRYEGGHDDSRRRQYSIRHLVLPSLAAHEHSAVAPRSRQRAVRPGSLLSHRAARHGVHRRGARGRRPSRHAGRSPLQSSARAPDARRRGPRSSASPRCTRSKPTTCWRWPHGCARSRRTCPSSLAGTRPPRIQVRFCRATYPPSWSTTASARCRDCARRSNAGSR